MTRALTSSAGSSARDRLQQPGRRLVARARPVAQDEAALLAGGEAPDAAPQVVGRAQQRRGALEQELPGLGQRHLVRRAAQQLDAELLLEQAHLAAQRRLGDMQALAARVKLRSVATATK